MMQGSKFPIVFPQGAAAPPMDPRIGILMREGSCVYYAFANGRREPAVEGSLEQVEFALGLRERLAATVSKPTAASVPRASAEARPKRALRDFVVSVVPSVLSYGAHGCDGPYTVTVYAKSHADAISQARQQRRDNEGRHAVSATFQAQLLRDTDELQ